MFDLIVQLAGFGIIITSTIFFSLVYRYFKDREYYSILLLCSVTAAFAMVYAIWKFIIITTVDVEAAYQVFRIRELIAVSYLLIIPHFFSFRSSPKGVGLKIKRALNAVGVVLLCTSTVVAFAYPEGYVSSPTLSANGDFQVRLSPLYYAAQGLIALELIVLLVVSVVEVASNRVKRANLGVPIGMIICCWLSVSTISGKLFGVFLDPFPPKIMSRSITGLIWLCLSISLGYFLAFLRQAREVRDSRDALELSERRLRITAYQDELTGLGNRRKFLLDLQSCIEKHQDAAIVLADLDRFLEFNECYGSETGDEILKQVAKAVIELEDREALAYRMGGDEFSLILTGSGTGPKERALALKERVAEGFLVNNRKHSFGLAMSIARVPADGSNADELLSNAYAALSEAKQSRNTIVDFNDELKQDALARVSSIQELREALRWRAFYLVYQPIHDVTGRVSSVEALVRWRRPTGLQELGPAMFIPILESAGLMPEMGEFIVERIIEDLGAVLSSDRPFPLISINLSPHELRNEHLAGNLALRFADAQIPLHRLQFEVTESAFMDKEQVSVRNLQYLRELGSRIALDDFGTGYSNMAYLQSLPIDKIKIDQHFTRKVPGDRASEGLLIAFADIARSFELPLVAEGVETLGQLSFLRQHGYQEYQGFHFSAAISAKNLFDYVEKSRHHERVP